MPIEAAPTVRDSLVSAMETVMPETPAVTPAPAADTPLPVEAKEIPAPAETEAQKTERLRNEDGTFAKGKAPEKKVEAAPAAAVAPAEPLKPKVPRPSSWKKELEQHWDTLDPAVQAYVGQREREYATGVSTYKTEADRAKDVMTTLSQFEPELQRRNVPVAQWLTKGCGRKNHPGLWRGCAGALSGTQRPTAAIPAAYAAAATAPANSVLTRGH